MVTFPSGISVYYNKLQSRVQQHSSVEEHLKLQTKVPKTFLESGFVIWKLNVFSILSCPECNSASLSIEEMMSDAKVVLLTSASPAKSAIGCICFGLQNEKKEVLK